MGKYYLIILFTHLKIIFMVNVEMTISLINDYKKRNKKYDDMYYNRKLAMPNEVVEEIEYNNKQIKFLSKKLPRKYYGYTKSY